ncbi:Lactoylglutathione lyase [Rhodovastum atsumiense]|uniref:Aldoketomutase n=1 Tax=Rhodovastum atsumiense TaxID=504468 RepID=A0A5M6J0D7_9PROT|nr:lactoylglutathione lyase [Rhodovastum atsumiense]KAA5614054.1 lactoylglutathione lyase [Rhodovastum atsumiense]CAH2598869.1 Lactoylglutathione lyase [Rhodovastum atsumiense]
MTVSDTVPDHPVIVDAPRPGSVRVAVATKDGISVNLHFGHVRAFEVYEVDADGVRHLGQRSIEPYCKEDDDRATRMKGVLQVIGDCQGVLVARIGPVPKEMLAAAGLDAPDDYAFQAVEEAVTAFAAQWRSRGSAPAVAAESDGPGSPLRLLHAMLRVSDLERSLDFYTRLLGMQVIEQRDHKRNQFTQVYLGYGPGEADIGLELVFNWTREEPYQQGDAFGHLAIAVSGITALCDRLAAEGVQMPRPPRRQRHGERIVAFIVDPDGYQIELVQQAVPMTESP